MARDLTEKEAEEILREAEQIAETENVDSIDEVEEVVENSASGITEAQKDALKTVLAGSIMASGTLATGGLAGLAFSASATAHVVQNSNRIVEAYKDGADQAKEVYQSLKDEA